MYLSSYNTIILLYYILASVDVGNYLKTGYIHRFHLRFEKKETIFPCFITCCHPLAQVQLIITTSKL